MPVFGLLTTVSTTLVLALLLVRISLYHLFRRFWLLSIPAPDGIRLLGLCLIGVRYDDWAGHTFVFRVVTEHEIVIWPIRRRVWKILMHVCWLLLLRWRPVGVSLHKLVLMLLGHVFIGTARELRLLFGPINIIHLRHLINRLILLNSL